MPGTDSSTANARFSIQSKLSESDESAREHRMQRLLRLNGALGAMPWHTGGLRDDSQLAWLYATNDDMDAECTAHEISSVHFLHQSTAYPEMCQERLRLAADAIHRAVPTANWRDIWRLVVKYGIPTIKYAAAFSYHQSTELELEDPASLTEVCMGEANMPLHTLCAEESASPQAECASSATAAPANSSLEGMGIEPSTEWY